jgi:hypothetical protein
MTNEFFDKQNEILGSFPVKEAKPVVPEKSETDKILDPIRADIIKWLKTEEIDYYIDYNDSLSDEHIEQIVDKNVEDGYYAVNDEVYENNMDYQWDQEIELMKKLIAEFPALKNEEGEELISPQDLRDEFMDYFEYGPGFVDQLIDKTSAYVQISINQVTPNDFSIESDVKKIIKTFKDFIHLTGGSLTAKALYESFITVDTKEEINLYGIVIGGKADLRDIVEWKTHNDTKYLKIQGGLVGFGDANGDYGSPTKDMDPGMVYVRNILPESEKKENKYTAESKTVSIQYMRDYQEDSGITIRVEKNIPGFHLKAQTEIAKLPIYERKLAKWLKDLEDERSAEEKRQEEMRQERARFDTWRPALQDAADKLARSKPPEYWVDMTKLDKDSSWYRDKLEAAAKQLKADFDKSSPDSKLADGRFTDAMMIMIGRYVESAELKAKHRAAYDETMKKKPKLVGKAWEDMYPEDAPAEPVKATEALAGKTPADKEKTAKSYEKLTVDIIQPMIARNKKDSFWYDGEIAQVSFKARHLSVVASGEIRVEFPNDDRLYNNQQAVERATELKYTDKDLANDDKIVFVNNNWFDIEKSSGDNIEGTDVIAGEYDEAIQAAKDLITDDSSFDRPHEVIGHRVYEAKEEPKEPSFHLAGKSAEDKEATHQEIQRQKEEIEADTEEWVRTARIELEEELGCEIIVTETDDVSSGRCRMKKMAGDSSNGETNWFVCKDQDTADEYGQEYVQEQIEEGPENFNESFIQQHISIAEYDRRQIAEEEASNYVDEVLSQEDVIDEAGMQDEWDDVSNDEDMSDEDKDSKHDEILESAKEAVREKKENEIYEELEDPIQYFVTDHGMYSLADLLKSSFIQIDAEAAAEDAISSDGIGHYLDFYDGESIELPSGAVAFGE